ncbi:MAG: ABC transporter ATP-binding protein [Actinomycetota bacterium]
MSDDERRRGTGRTAGATPDSGAGWRLLVTSMRTQKLGLALGIGVGLAWAAGRVAIPLLVQLGIDRGIENAAADQRGWRSVLPWAIAIVAAGTFSGVGLGLRRYIAFRNARTIEARLRDRLFAHIQRLHFSFHDAQTTGDLMSRANTDLQQFQNFISMVPMLIGSVITVAAVAVIMVIIEPVLAVLALIGLPLVYVLGRAYSTRLFPTVSEIQQRSADLAAVVEEAVGGVRVIKGFGAEPLQVDRLGRAADRVHDAGFRALTIRSRFLPAMEAAPNLGLVIVLAYGGSLVLDGRLTIGQLVSFNAYVILLVQPLRTLGMGVTTGQRSAAAGVRVAELLATAPVINQPRRPAALPAGPPRGLVEFQRVGFAYEPGRPVLHGLDLTIEPGESVALVGPTGSGKTTVANLIPRFYDVDGGAVSVDGIDVRDLRPQDLRRQVGLVFEETFLFSASIAANIAFVDPEASMADIRRAAAAAGADFIDDLPQGWETEVGQRGYGLSGGQRQRLAIARAVLADPRILILDDATSAVDPTKEHEIADALAGVMERRTTIVIAHRPATVALADRVVLLDGGRVIDEGTHDELIATNATYRRVLALTPEGVSG